MKSIVSNKIDVEAALADSPYKGVSKALADEFRKVRINTKDQVKNAPVRLKVTFGVDIYAVMELIMNYKPIPKTTKKKRS